MIYKCAVFLVVADSFHDISYYYLYIIYYYLPIIYHLAI